MAMAAAEAVEELQPVAAPRTSSSICGVGSVPVDQVPYFTVGRERWLSIIKDNLEQLHRCRGRQGTFSQW